MTLRPDGFIGAVMAVEGITDATALLHGQTGCRKGLLLSQGMCPRPNRVVDVPVYSGCPTVPYSGINQGDYTGKSAGKLMKALDYISGEDYRLIVMFCSPGISIVGDDCYNAVKRKGLGDRTIILDDDLGREVYQGYDRAIEACLHKLCKGQRTVLPGTVTVVGLSIMHKDWTSVRKEMDHILEHLGLRCICYAGAGCTTEELEDSANAEFYIDLAPEYSENTRRFYDDVGMKRISIGCSPVGFDATERMFEEIGRVTGRNAESLRMMVASHKKRAYSCLCAADTDMRGRTFSVSAPPSVSVPLKEFLERSFSMVYSDTDYEILFADGNRCVMERASGKCRKCIDIGFPSNKVDFNRSPALGLNGTLYLLDALFN